MISYPRSEVITMKLVDWPESQKCMNCSHGQFHLSDTPSQYLCVREGRCVKNQ
jgi:hypothetical protein